MRLISDTLLQTMIGTLDGEPFVHFDGAQHRQILGVFAEPYQQVEGGAAPIVRNASRRLDLFVGHDVIAIAKQGDLLFRGTVASFAGTYHFRVSSAQPDETGRAGTLQLKTVTPAPP